VGSRQRAEGRGQRNEVPIAIGRKMENREMKKVNAKCPISNVEY
jgi:hypothetical protein